MLRYALWVKAVTGLAQSSVHHRRNPSMLGVRLCDLHNCSLPWDAFPTRHNSRIKCITFFI